MNKVTTINLNGIAFQLEEAGYEVLRKYIDTAAVKLGANPDKDEIIADIEQAIAEKFRSLLGTHKNVVNAKEVADVIQSMGPVEDGSESKADSAAAGGPSAGFGTPGANPVPPQRPRRLYRLNEGAMFAGVCSGLGAFTGLPPVFVRFLFLALTLGTWGLGGLVYLAMIFIVPLADSTTERAEAQGATPTAQDFIRRAREGYYEAMKGFPDRQARREWKRKFKSEAREWRENFRRNVQSDPTWWQQNWGACCPPPRMMPFSPFLILLTVLGSTVLLLGFLFGLITFVMSGTFFGFPAPSGMPLWLGILLLIIVFQFLSWPLKAIRRANCYGRCGHGFPGTLFLLVILLGFSWWIYPTQTRQFIDDIPAHVHKVVDDVQAWWAKK